VSIIILQNLSPHVPVAMNTFHVGLALRVSGSINMCYIDFYFPAELLINYS